MKFSKKKQISAKTKKNSPLLSKINLSRLEEIRLSVFKGKSNDVILQHCLIPRVRLVNIDLKLHGEKFNKKVELGIDNSCVFLVPVGITEQEAYKIVSYVYKKIQKNHGCKPSSKDAFNRVSQELEKYGFEKTDYGTELSYSTLISYSAFKGIKTNLHELEYCKDLITYHQNTMGLFNKTDLSKRYFDWYNPSVTSKQIQKIYYNHGLNVPKVLDSNLEK